MALTLVNDELSFSDRAYLAIRRLIVTLALEPGSVISESDLMIQLGLGRTPVREALRRLANERLVDVYPRRGMFVAGVDPRDLSALFEIREQLEPFAAHLAATRRNPADIEVINELLADLDAVAGDARRLIDLDQRMHEHVYQCSHNEFLATTLDQHYMHALRIWFLALDRVTDLEGAVLEHRGLLEAIRDGDAPRAEVLMRKHVAGFETSIHRNL
ncbi:MAG TPA: GntR family transcriptional regulator [Candidatus Nanopelagicaceae bacterium]|nr:GntR family transcriptional regulator [Candidatus Nanopelagicaceae bacterium]